MEPLKINHNLESFGKYLKKISSKRRKRRKKLMAKRREKNDEFMKNY